MAAEHGVLYTQINCVVKLVQSCHSLTLYSIPFSLLLKTPTVPSPGQQANLWAVPVVAHFLECLFHLGPEKKK